MSPPGPVAPVAPAVLAVLLPVVRADGTRAALELQDVDEETVGEGRPTRRFDLMTETLGVDRDRARAWTPGRWPSRGCCWGGESPERGSGGAGSRGQGSGEKGDGCRSLPA